MNVRVYPNGDLASIAAAVLIAGQVVDNPRSVLGLATGSTPLPIYRELIAMAHRGVLDFQNVTTYNLDEYAGLGPDHPCSYRRVMEENLFSHPQMRPEQIHIPLRRTRTPSAAPTTRPSPPRAGWTCSCWAWAPTGTSGSTSPRRTSRRTATACA